MLTKVAGCIGLLRRPSKSTTKWVAWATELFCFTFLEARTQIRETDSIHVFYILEQCNMDLI